MGKFSRISPFHTQFTTRKVKQQPPQCDGLVTLKKALNLHQRITDQTTQGGEIEEDLLWIQQVSCIPVMDPFTQTLFHLFVTLDMACKSKWSDYSFQ